MKTIAIFILLAHNMHAELTNLHEFVGIDHLQAVVKELELDVAPVIPTSINVRKIEKVAAGFAQGVISGEKLSWGVCQKVALPNVGLIIQGLKLLRQGFLQRNITKCSQGCRKFLEVVNNIQSIETQCEALVSDANSAWEAIKSITSFKCLMYKLKANSKKFHYQIWDSIAKEIYALRDQDWHAVGLYLGMVFHYLHFGDYLMDGRCTEDSHNSCLSCHEGRVAEHCGNSSDANNFCVSRTQAFTGCKDAQTVIPGGPSPLKLLSLV